MQGTTLQSTIKARHKALLAAWPNALVSIRVGDFYEFYGEQAKTVAAALQITLTGRSLNGTERTPMAGFPFHNAPRYIAQLEAQGHTVVTDEGPSREEYQRFLNRGGN